MEIGSQAHKELFCRTFLEEHREYEPQDLPWPKLDAESLALLRGIPFWDEALRNEEDAGPMVSAYAATAADPLVREALALQGEEESRHGRIIRFMIRHYQLEVKRRHVDEQPEDLERAYIDFGFEECLDSFGAFGLYQLAREADLFPAALFEIFDRVMDEEAHHIVFFVNWFAYRQAKRGTAALVFRHSKSLWHYGKALKKLIGLWRDPEAEQGADFIASGAQAFVDDLTPRQLLATCLRENARRMSRFDERLLQPRLVPGLAQATLAGCRLVPLWREDSRPNGSPSNRPRATRLRGRA